MQGEWKTPHIPSYPPSLEWVRGTGHDESGNGKIVQLDSYSITHPSLITIIRHSYHTIKTSPTISRDLIKNNKNPASILNTEDPMTGIPSRGVIKT